MTIPDTFQIHGYFETLHEISTNKTLGTRKVEYNLARGTGEASGMKVELTAPFVLDRGPKTKRFTASKEKPRICWSTINPICGKSTWKHPQQSPS